MRYLTENLINQYTDRLQAFRDEHSLFELFPGGIDHLAVKMFDAADYELYREEMLPLVAAMTEVDLDGRRIATAKLKQSIPLVASDGEQLGVAGYLEIMEPRPAKVGKDLVGIDHCEVNIASFVETQSVLALKGISTNQSKGEDEYQHTVVVCLDESGQEVKFSDEPLSQLIVKELEEGKSRQLK